MTYNIMLRAHDDYIRVRVYSAYVTRINLILSWLANQRAGFWDIGYHSRIFASKNNHLFIEGRKIEDSAFA